MSEFEPVIPQERVDRLYSELDGRVASEDFDTLSTMFEADLPQGGTLNRLQALKKVAAEHWNFRKGAERQAVPWDESELFEEGSESWNAVFSHTDSLGLVTSTSATAARYDALLDPGAANWAPYLRLKYGVEQTYDGSTVTFGRVILLGAGRELQPAEKEKTADYAPGAQIEHDLMNGAAESLLKPEGYTDFKLSSVGYEHEDKASVRAYHMANGQGVHSLYSPAPVGQQRATTANTYQHLQAYAPNEITEGAKLLLSTNAFYAPAQEVDAKRCLTLPTGAEVEAIGFAADHFASKRYEDETRPEWVVKRQPAQLLQETKAYIDAMDRLAVALGDAATTTNATYL